MKSRLFIILFFLAIISFVFTNKTLMAYEYIGCYKDSGNPSGLEGRDLNGFMYSDPNMTVEKCINLCRQKGFAYAGVQYSTQCFCGNSYGKYGRATNCNMKCGGNPYQICGGFWSNSVYSTSLKPRRGFEYNIDRPGLDYKSFDLPYADPGLCKSACDADPKCKAWTYVKPNTIQGPNPRCWLKFGVPSPVRNNCCISGVKHIPTIQNIGAVNLTGVWRCDDGGLYYIRQIGNNIYWYGEKSPRSPLWSNVAYGIKRGNKIELNWADVPKGSLLNHGKLVIKIVNPFELRAVRKIGGFGGNRWIKKRNK